MNQSNTALVPVFEGELAGESIQLVNARDLHAALGVGARFNDWMARRIEQYGFVDGEDFYSKLSKTSGRPTADYHLTLDMAKELAMLENNEKGRAVRRYFIRCEKELRTLPEPGEVSLISLVKESRAAMDLAKAFGLEGNQAMLTADRLVRQFTGSSPLALMDMSHLTKEKQLPNLTPTQIGERLSMSARKVNKLLEAAGLQEHQGDGWAVTHAGHPYAVLLDTGRQHSTGTPVVQIKWTEDVIEVLAKVRGQDVLVLPVGTKRGQPK